MKIVMTLKSDAIPGSGNSLAGIIDRDIAYDKFGLPYIPSKRIKGILRESAEELTIDEEALFGVEGDNTGCDFRIDNGYLEGHLEYRQLLSAVSQGKSISDFLPPQAVLDYFTYTRSQTTINEDGVAKKKSLRVSRVLKKGLTFEFNVENNKNDEADLKRICKVTRNFGASRTRGFGEIELECHDAENSQNAKKTTDDTSSEENISGNIAKMRLIVENKGQLLISSRPGKNQVSEDYITGATVLGAVAGNYIKEKNGVDNDFKDLFLYGKISFGNLYPTIESNETITHFYPSPLSIKRVKENKINKHLEEFYDHSELDENNEILTNVIFKGGFPDFVSEKNSEKVNTIKNIEAHHRRPSDRHIAKSTKSDGDFFQFETIEGDQVFAGEIIGEATLLNKVRKYFPENGELRLGKSKTGQYGKCKYILESPVLLSEESDDDFEWDNGEEEKFIFRSDMILLNENGFPTPDINLFKKELAGRLFVRVEELEIVKQFSKTTNAGGFWGVWKMPRIQKPAISAGTVVVLKNNSGKNLKAENIETMFFGDRTEDGFGRIAVYENDKQGLSEPDTPDPTPNVYHFDNVPDKVKALIRFQVEKIVKQKLHAKAIKQVNPIPINAFIGKLVGYLKRADSFEDFDDKIAALKSTKQEANLKKIAKKLLIKDEKVDQESFKTEVAQAQTSAPKMIQEKYPIEPHFRLYQHYALAYLTQVKFKNRKGGV